MPRGKTKQTRLSFKPPAAASQDKDSTQRDPGDQKSRHANLRYGHPSLATVRRGKPPSAAAPSPPANTQSSTIEDERSAPSVREKLPSKAVSGKEKNGGFLWITFKGLLADLTIKANAVDEDSDSDSDLEIAPRKPRKKETQQPLKRKRSRVSEKAVSEDEESDQEEVTNRPRRKLRHGAASKPVVLDDDDEEEDHASQNPEKSEEEKEEEEDDDDEPIIATPAKRKRNIVTEDPQTPRRGSDQDQIDIEEDLEDLQDSVVKETRTRGRLANSARSKRQQHLETLRRRRAGEATDPVSDEPETIEEEGEEEEESDSEGSQPKDTSATYQTRLDGLQPDNSDVESAIASNEDLDRYDEDFVSEDENDPLGVPAAGIEEMPLEFTRHAYKQTKEYFRDAVEWMVHNQLNPAFSRSAPLYKVAFGKLEDEVKGRTGSQLISSVWNAGFHRALVARPHIEVTLYPLLDNHPCDACNRSGHPASAEIKLYGKAYSLDTLEAISDDDSDDDDDEEERADKKETDRDGNILPDQSTRFFLGRYVMPALNHP